MLRLVNLSRLVKDQVLSKVSRNIRVFSSNVELEDGGEIPPKKSKVQQVVNVHPVVAERLKTRSVLTVSGQDSIVFLNNLTTNELNQLKNEAVCLHTFFLNAKGRIIHDALVYRPDDDDTLFIECDISSLQALQTHLIMYRYAYSVQLQNMVDTGDNENTPRLHSAIKSFLLNRPHHANTRAKTNVDIRSVEQEVSVWTVYDPLEIDNSAVAENSPHDTSFLEDLDLGCNILQSRDPRMWPLGMRILAPKEIDIAQTLKIAGVKTTDAPNGTYKSVRFKLGVAEGNAEIGYGRSLPAEINGDYTNAICLSKTNYTGWSPEALKKTVENRMLPLKFHGNPSQLTANSPITDKRGKKRSPIGYLRGIQGSFGLGLMHISSILTDRYCIVGKVGAECIRPPWWKNEVKSSNINELREASQ